jgi:hypothetical protein
MRRIFDDLFHSSLRSAASAHKTSFSVFLQIFLKNLKNLSWQKNQPSSCPKLSHRRVPKTPPSFHIHSVFNKRKQDPTRHSHRIPEFFVVSPHKKSTKPVTANNPISQILSLFPHRSGAATAH